MSGPVVPLQRGAPADGSESRGVAGWCAWVAESRPFEILIIVVIGANAVMLGIETYPHLGAAGPMLRCIDAECDVADRIGVVLLEQVIRPGRPMAFFAAVDMLAMAG
ncbi:hypothetical protein [Micromonospora sp. 4G55]|uniref:hypothetical protein n=1 Tax=Micromonospora sp. 4G55 TaxID=2806102 RepID=UPI001A6281B3|nr:hypothetical protein [Micromonospora sp. 4G55]MBM0255468.1 hypothetical protein [Micromonospora sp. 4G55]